MDLSEYWRNQYEQEVRPGATVMTLFSIRLDELPEAAERFRMASSMTAICLHLLGVIVLTEPTDPFNPDQQPDFESVRGVKALPRLDVSQLEVQKTSRKYL